MTETSFIPGWMIVVPLLTIAVLLVWGFIAAVTEEPDSDERARAVGLPDEGERDDDW